MGTDHDLLRRLEPIFRPDGQPKTPRAPGPSGGASGAGVSGVSGGHADFAQPFETRTFESLLEEARLVMPPAEPQPLAYPHSVEHAQPPKPKPPPTTFDGIDRIENASLRKIMAQHASDPTHPNQQ